MKVKVLIIVEVAKCVYVKFIFAHLGNVMELGIVKFEMAEGPEEEDQKGMRSWRR